MGKAVMITEMLLLFCICSFLLRGEKDFYSVAELGLLLKLFLFSSLLLISTNYFRYKMMHTNGGSLFLSLQVTQMWDGKTRYDYTFTLFQFYEHLLLNTLEEF